MSMRRNSRTFFLSQMDYGPKMFGIILLNNFPFTKFSIKYIIRIKPSLKLK